MTDPNTTLENLAPKTKPRLFDLVRDAGLDVSDWSNFKGGPQKEASNPKYCYEWGFEQNGLFVVNIWMENMKVVAGEIIQTLNLRETAASYPGLRKLRANRFDQIVINAFRINAHPWAILLDRSRKDQRVQKRKLDPLPWTISKYNYETGEVTLVRGIVQRQDDGLSDPELAGFPEGEQRTRFIKHRRRERKIRDIKLKDHMDKNGGQLVCEPPGCEFDFSVTYGDLGEGYAQVHHLLPLSEAPKEGVMTKLEDLAVVCANCHVMIHRGGQNRDLKDIIPEGAGNG